jgi:hypothetical protein
MGFADLRIDEPEISQPAGRNLRRFGVLKPPSMSFLSFADNTLTSRTWEHPADPDLVYVEKRSELSPAAGGLRAP